MRRLGRYSLGRLLGSGGAGKVFEATLLGPGGVPKDKKPAHQVSEFNVSTEKLAGGVFDSNGYVEFTYFGTDFTCGTIKADDGRSKIEGTFITHYKKVN